MSAEEASVALRSCSCNVLVILCAGSDLDMTFMKSEMMYCRYNPVLSAMDIV